MKLQSALATLTKKEKVISKLLAKGLLYKEISDVQNISINTVKKHTTNIYAKLNVRNRTEACSIILSEEHN